MQWNKKEDINNTISDPYKLLWYALVSCGDKWSRRPRFTPPSSLLIDKYWLWSYFSLSKATHPCPLPSAGRTYFCFTAPSSWKNSSLNLKMLSICRWIKQRCLQAVYKHWRHFQSCVNITCVYRIFSIKRRTLNKRRPRLNAGSKLLIFK